MTGIGRRTFIEGLAASGGIALIGGCRMPYASGDYEVAVLGDTHYDTVPDTVYHEAFLTKYAGTDKHPARFKEFVRNAQMWAGPSRRILEASGRCAAAHPTEFVLQLGDLVQGDCSDFGVHRRMLADTLAFMKGVYPEGLPFLPVCGNHDIRHGDDVDDDAAWAPCDEAMVPYSRAQLGSRVCAASYRTTYGFRSGPDLYVMVNFNQGRDNVPAVKRLLDENRDARYTFLVTHGGVFPFDCWACRWFYLGNEKDDALRREMRSLLAARNAIVLCGHTHHLELKEADFPEGRITEMTMNTVFGKSKGGENPAEPENVREGVEAYGNPEWEAKKPSVKALFDEYRPHMRRFFHADAVGHARMRVSDSGVWFDFYGRDALTPTRTFRLR